MLRGGALTLAFAVEKSGIDGGLDCLARVGEGLQLRGDQRHARAHRPERHAGAKPCPETLHIAGVGHGIVPQDERQQGTLTTAIRPHHQPTFPFVNLPIQPLEQVAAIGRQMEVTQTEDAGRREGGRVLTEGERLGTFLRWPTGALRLNLAVTQTEPMGRAGRNLILVAHGDDQGAALRGQLVECIAQSMLHGRVKPGEGVVQRKGRGEAQDGPRKHHTALLAVRQLKGLPLQERVQQQRLARPVKGPGEGLVFGGLRFAHLKGADVVHGLIGQRLGDGARVIAHAGVPPRPGPIGARGGGLRPKGDQCHIVRITPRQLRRDPSLAACRGAGHHPTLPRLDRPGLAADIHLQCVHCVNASNNFWPTTDLSR